MSQDTNQPLQAPKRIGTPIFPDLPSHLLARSDKLSELIAKLINPNSKSPSITSSQKIEIHGMGGIGKSTLATILGYTDYEPLSLNIDQKIKLAFWEAFSDGIIWLKLGDKAVDSSLATLQTSLIDALKQQEYFSSFSTTFSTEGSINKNKSLLRDFFASKKCLLILDDIWHTEQIEAFDIFDNNSKVVFTTRNSDIFIGIDDKYYLTELKDKESLQLLANWAEVELNTLDSDAKEITHKWCENLPFGIKLCGGLFKYRKNFGFTWSDLLKALTDCNLKALSHPQLKIDSFIKVSLNMLEMENNQLAELYLQLIVFPPDKQIPFETIATFWQNSYPELEDYLIKGWISELASRGLLKIVSGVSQTVELHSFLYVYLAGSLPKKQRQKLHNNLLRSYRKDPTQVWYTIKNDGYYYENLTYHLYGAGRTDEIQELLLDYSWLEKKLLITNIYSLLSDFSFLDTTKPDICLLKHTLEVSSHILAQDCNQLSSQLLGRLDSSSTVLNNLLTNASQEKTSPWLKPLLPSFVSSPYLYGTLIDDRSSFKSVLAYQWQDKFFAISISSSILDSEELKIWDLETKTKLYTLKEHSSAVKAVAIYQHEDKLFAISVGVGEIIIWDLCSYSIAGILIDYFYTLVQSVKVYKEQNKIFALFVLLNGTFEIWDLSNNFESYLFQGHSFGVRNLALYQDNNDLVAVSASYNELRFWDLSNKKEITRIEGYFGSHNPIEIYKDQNKFFIIYPDYNKLKLYNLTDKIEIDIILEHPSSARSMAVYQKNSKWFAISTSKNNTLKIWDLSTKKEIAILNGHSSDIECVTVYQQQNKHFAVSASKDHSMKIWDLTTIQPTPNLIERSYPIYSISVYQKQNKLFAISTSVDGYTIWDLEVQQKITTFRPKPTLLSSVMHQQNDSIFIISGSFDKTISVCDIGNKTEVITINTTHSGNIYSLASYQDRGKLFVISTSEDSALKIWDIFSETPEIEIATLKGHDDSVYSVGVYEKSNKFFAISVSKDHTLKIWDLETYKIIKSFEINNICTVITIYQENNEILAVCGLYGKVKILNLTNKIEHATLETNSSLIKSLAVYSQKDNIFIVIGSVDHTIRVWDLKNRKEVTKITLDHGILSVAVTKDGLIVAGDDYGQTHFLQINRQDSISSISKPKETISALNPQLTNLQNEMPDTSTNKEKIANLKKGSKFMKRSNIDPQTLLKLMQIDPHPDNKISLTYILGCFEKRVTIYSQQVRALNLIYSLFADKRISKNSKICIIGAGIAGLTAAVAAAYKGCDVTLLEKATEPLTIFRYNHNRYLHPHIYDWPEESSEDSNANLPLMNWRAGLTKDVVDQFKQGWESFKDKVNFVSQIQDIDITLNFHPTVYFRNSILEEEQEFEVLIVAVGFGEEKPENSFPKIGSVSPYWGNDHYDEIARDENIKDYLVAGCGDGGLTDLLRVKLRHFRHEHIIKDYFSITTPEQELIELKSKLIEIENQAYRENDSSKYLCEQYSKLKIPNQIDDNINSKLRSDTRVALNGVSPYPLTLISSILNRFLVSRLIINKKVRYIPNKVESITFDNGKYIVSIKDKDPKSYDDVIIRFGPVPAINNFPIIVSRCKDIKSRSGLDQTRDPMWEEGFFGSEVSDENF